MARNSIVRTYHSWGILLPDATILTGGGGLCGTCDTNHFDAQIFTPRYLLTPTGERAKRPTIIKTSADSVKPGNKITVTTDGAIDSASLIRYSSATHGVNTDQRRIPLDIAKSGSNQYDFTVPEGGIATPGFWMLFVIDSQKVPSISKKLQILVESS